MSLGMSIKVNGTERVFSVLKGIKSVPADLREPFNECGVILRNSWAQNFKAQGRPNKWSGLKASTQADRKRNKFNPESPIGVQTGEMMKALTTGKGKGAINSIGKQKASFGSESVKAVVFNFGRNKGSKQKARETVMLNDKDGNKIVNAFRKFLRKKAGI
jgi:phage gpG-like protein